MAFKGGLPGTRTPLDIALTFDDGYLEHYQVARTLRSFGVRATFFLITGLQDWDGRPLLTKRKELIKEMSRMGHEIGSHTATHPRMTAIPSPQIEEELAESKRTLEEITGSEVSGFAYPYGTLNETTKSQVARHYSYGRAAENLGRRADRYSIGIRHPGRSLAHCCVSRPVDVLTNRGGYPLLFHAVPFRSLVIWVSYLRSTGTRFVTMRELVALGLGLGTRRASQ